VAFSPNVVILGRSNDTIDNEYIKSIISSVDPNGVPGEFIHRVFVIDEYENRYVVPNEFYSKGIKYSTLEKSLSKIKTEHPVKTIEIVIDLLSVKDRLDVEYNELFSNIPDTN
jgi:hypothetical protein